MSLLEHLHTTWDTGKHTSFKLENLLRIAVTSFYVRKSIKISSTATISEFFTLSSGNIPEVSGDRCSTWSSVWLQTAHFYKQNTQKQFLISRWVVIWELYHMLELDRDEAQHISCFPHLIQFLWDTDSLVHIVLYKELDLVPCMSVDMLYHILCTLDPQWNILFLLMYQCV